MKILHVLAMMAGLIFLLSGCKQQEERLTNPFIDKLGNPDIAGTLIMEDYQVWGASVIQDKDGKYYMFVSLWPANFGSWVTNSQVALAVADKPEGPYSFEKIVLAPRNRKFWDGGMSHNPTIRYHKGKYYLFYIGSTFDFATPEDKVNGNRDERYQKAWNMKRIGVAIADHPTGPWQRFDRPIIEPRAGHWDAVITSNPAPVIHEDGSVTIIYKSISKPYPERIQGSKEEQPFLTIGVAHANHIFGEYKRLGTNDGLITIEGEKRHLEDMYVWHDGEYFHMTVKDFTTDFIDEKDAGIYVWSKNASEWFLPKGNARAYSRQVKWSNGIESYQAKFERAQLLFNNKGEISHIFFANRFSSEYKDIDPANGRAYNVVIPLK